MNLNDFADLTDLAAITDELPTVVHSAGAVVFHEGSAGDFLYVISSGKVKISRRAHDGRQNLLALIGPGDVFGELALFDPAPRAATAIALTELICHTLDGSAFRTVSAHSPQLAELLMRTLARRLRQANDTVADMIFADVPGRVAKQLLVLADQFGVSHSTGLRVDHDLTQLELAQLVGSSRETVNKALCAFVDRGWIQVRTKGVLICEPKKLALRASSCAGANSQSPTSRPSEDDVIDGGARGAGGQPKRCQPASVAPSRAVIRPSRIVV